MVKIPDDEAHELPRKRMTLEQWADMDEDEPGELVDGHLVPDEEVTFLHEAAVVWLIGALGGWAQERGAHVLASGLKFGIHRLGRGRKADLSMYLPGTRLPGRNCMLVTRPPDVIVEVLADDPDDVRRDRVDKLVEYAGFGVRYYWILDPKNRTLEIHELDGQGRYRVAQAASEGTLPAHGCEGLNLNLDDLWARLDSLAEAEA